MTWRVAPSALYDEWGRKAFGQELDIYGVSERSGETTKCPWRWPGQYEDEETGLYYNRFRYYDPSASRYISQDPIRLEGGLNLYGYVEDPLTLGGPVRVGEEEGGEVRE